MRALLALTLTLLIAAAQDSKLTVRETIRSPGFTAYQRADALFVARKFPECQAAIEEALRLDPKLVPALTLKAKLAMTIYRFDIARESLEKALEADPSSASAQFLYGLEAYLTNDLQSALPRFEKARQLNPADPRGALYLGMTRESLGQPADALKLYEEAVRLEQSAGTPQADTFLAGSRLLLLMGRLEDSKSWIERALKLEPNSRAAHFEYARFLQEKGDAIKAATEAEMALRLTGGDPTDVQIHYLLIRAYRESERPAEVARHADAIRALGSPKSK